MSALAGDDGDAKTAAADGVHAACDAALKRTAVRVKVLVERGGLSAWEAAVRPDALLEYLERLVLGPHTAAALRHFAPAVRALREEAAAAMEPLDALRHKGGEAPDDAMPALAGNACSDWKDHLHTAGVEALAPVLTGAGLRLSGHLPTHTAGAYFVVVPRPPAVVKAALVAAAAADGKLQLPPELADALAKGLRAVRSGDVVAVVVRSSNALATVFTRSTPPRWRCLWCAPRRAAWRWRRSRPRRR